MRKPLPLRKGDVIAVCAPAGPVSAGRLDRGIARLASAGYVPEIAEGVLAAEGYLAGGDDHRTRQVEWALTLPEARAVMAARGGFGTTRILPRIDWRKAARRRKILVGFSDLTAVLSYLSTRLRFPCIHGPMAAADLALRFDAGALDAFARLSAGKVSPREPWGPPMERLRGGAAEGVLILTDLGRGVTAMQGKSMYTGNERSILMCALTVTEVHNLKSAVAKEDPQAFVIVSPAQEILGRGFNPLEEK